MHARMPPTQPANPPHTLPATQVVEAFGLCLAEWGYVSAGSLPRRLDVLLFSCATAAILHCYSDHHGQRRAVFRSKYLTVFDAILGNTGGWQGRGPPQGRLTVVALCVLFGAGNVICPCKVWRVGAHVCVAAARVLAWLCAGAPTVGQRAALVSR